MCVGHPPEALEKEAGAQQAVLEYVFGRIGDRRSTYEFFRRPLSVPFRPKALAPETSPSVQVVDSRFKPLAFLEIGV
jgi:hypothetical protein